MDCMETSVSKAPSRRSPAGRPAAQESLDPADWEGLRALGHRMVDELLAWQRGVRGRFALRVCIVNHRTRDEDVELLVAETARIGDQLVMEGSFDDESD